MYQTLDGCLIEVRTMTELSSGWRKGGCGFLIEVAALVNIIVRYNLFWDFDHWPLNRWLFNENVTVL